jgi:hypothetical protein
MAQRRTQSAERAGFPPADAAMLGRLTEVLEQLGQDRERPVHHDRFKAPHFDGNGEVDYFIQQFRDVAMANQWVEPAALLHLRQALKEGARDCGRAQSTLEVYATLRARYGLTEDEARGRLNTIRRGTRTSLQAHAVEIGRLVEAAYGGMNDRQRAGMALDAFKRSLNNMSVAEHLLARRPGTMEEAVQARNEFLLLRSTTTTPVRALDGDEEHQIRPIEPAGNPTMEAMMQLLIQLTQKMENFGTSRAPNPIQTNPVVCWSCGGREHVRKDCPMNRPGPTQRNPKRSGNDQRPGQ